MSGTAALYDVILTNAYQNHPQIIKVLMEGLGLSETEAKSIIEFSPKLVLENAPGLTAKQLKKDLEKAGASVFMELHGKYNEYYTSFSYTLNVHSFGDRKKDVVKVFESFGKTKEQAEKIIERKSYSIVQYKESGKEQLRKEVALLLGAGADVTFHKKECSFLLSVVDTPEDNEADVVDVEYSILLFPPHFFSRALLLLGATTRNYKKCRKNHERKTCGFYFQKKQKRRFGKSQCFVPFP